MYMRLLGYPADKISILTTYNGQKHLIRDVVNQRCGNNPFMGRPNKVTTYFFYFSLLKINKQLNRQNNFKWHKGVYSL